MNRRDFLQRSSFAALAVAGLPKAVRQGDQANYPSVYKTELAAGPNQLYYEAGLYHSALMNFNAAKDDEKVIGLKVLYYKTADRSTPSSTGEFRYIIKSAVQIDTTNNIWKLTTKADKKEGNYKLPKDFAKNLEFECKPYSYVRVAGKKDAELVKIPYPPTNNNDDDIDGSGCFLTTACVAHKRLEDDCEELTTLRLLRDGYMRSTAGGRAMIRQYKKTGPAIVNAINSCRNKGDIYEYMHRHMIVPSVQLVKEGRYEEATGYYKAFVAALQQQYC